MCAPGAQPTFISLDGKIRSVDHRAGRQIAIRRLASAFCARIHLTAGGVWPSAGAPRVAVRRRAMRPAGHSSCCSARAAPEQLKQELHETHFPFLLQRARSLSGLKCCGKQQQPVWQKEPSERLSVLICEMQEKMMRAHLIWLPLSGKKVRIP